MNKILCIPLLLCSILSCQLGDTKNTYTISGTIGFMGTTEVNVHLLKGDEIIATRTSLEFTFENLEEGTDYTILPVSKDYDNGRNGISTLDLVEVGKYIDGLIEFDLFQKIAADVNKDNVINSIDVAIMKDCILSSIKTFQCPTYRFVSAEHDENSFAYVDQYQTGKLFSDHEITFLPIKLGDVNNTTHN